MTVYQLTASSIIYRIDDGAYIPADTDNIDYQAYLDWIAQGNAPKPADLPSLQQVIAAKIRFMDAKVAERLNSQAQLRGFDSIASAGLSAALPVGEYKQADGAALLLWSARTWQKAALIRDAFLAGIRPEPTWEEIESELPDYPIE